VTAVYIYDIITNSVIDRIGAIRCYRLGEHYVDIEYDPERHLIYYFYLSNRGNPWISFYYIPPNLTETEAHRLVLEAHGLV
jgi:hypothetical protein